MSAGLVLHSRYELTARLAAGGFGSVWRAHDRRMDREVAVKLLHPTSADSSRFSREARALARLNHPNIVTAHDYGIDGDIAYLVMELVAGTSLADELIEARLHMREGLPLPDVLDIALQVSSGLGAAHAAGLVHRDLKPRNLMRGGDHRVVKIVDFGIAHAADMSRMTTSGSVLGTLPYMAPEQLTGVPLDGRADLYSLGCVLFELLTGRSAFVAYTPASWMHAHQSVAPAQLRDVLPGAPADLAELIDQLLAKDRSARPPNALAVAEAITDLRAGRVRAATTHSFLDDVPTEPADAYPPPSGAVIAQSDATTASNASHGPIRPAQVGAGTKLRRWQRPVVAVALAAAITGAAIVAIHVLGTNAHVGPGRLRGATAPHTPSAGNDPGPSRSPSPAPSTGVRSTSSVAAVTAKPSVSAATRLTGTISDTQAVLTVNAQQEIDDLAWSPDQSRLAVAGLNGDNDRIRTIDTRTGDVRQILTGTMFGVYSVAWSPNGKLVASGNNDSPAIQVWNARTGTSVGQYHTHSEEMMTVAFSPDGSTVVGGSADGRIEVWDVATGQERASFRGSTGIVDSVSWSADGSEIVTGSHDGSIRIWTASGHLVRSLPSITPAFATLRQKVIAVWSPDGHRIAAGVGNSVLVWNAATGTRLSKHSGVAAPLAWSPDSTQLATAADAGQEIRVWAVATDSTVRTFDSAADDLAWSPDGRYIASCAGGTSVSLWSTTS